MKTINKFRSTNVFCLNGTDAGSVARVFTWVEANGWAVVAIANDPENCCRFTVRAYERAGLGSTYDFVIETYGTVPRVVDRAHIAGAEREATLGFNPN